MSKEINELREDLYKRALELSRDGSFSRQDYDSLGIKYDSRDALNNEALMSAGINRGGIETGAAEIARALYESNAVLEDDAANRINKYQKNSIQQFRTPGGGLKTSFLDGPRAWRDMAGERKYRGSKRDSGYNYPHAPITGEWTTSRPNSRPHKTGVSRSGTTRNYRTYSHDGSAPKTSGSSSTTASSGTSATSTGGMGDRFGSQIDTKSLPGVQAMDYKMPANYDFNSAGGTAGGFPGGDIHNVYDYYSKKINKHA